MSLPRLNSLTEPRAVLLAREQRQRQRLQTAGRSLLGLGPASSPAQVPRGLLRPVRRHPLASIAVAAGLGFALAPRRGRAGDESGSASGKGRPLGDRLSSWVGRALIFSRFVDSAARASSRLFVGAEAGAPRAPGGDDEP